MILAGFYNGIECERLDCEMQRALEGDSFVDLVRLLASFGHCKKGSILACKLDGNGMNRVLVTGLTQWLLEHKRLSGCS